MAEAGRLASPTGLRALTYTTLIGLLTATGLRLGEALALDRSDVDLDNGILAIRQTEVRQIAFCANLGLHARGSSGLCPAAGYSRHAPPD